MEVQPLRLLLQLLSLPTEKVMLMAGGRVEVMVVMLAAS